MKQSHDMRQQLDRRAIEMPLNNLDILDEVLNRFRAHGEPLRVHQARADKNSQLEFLAIKVPVVRALVRQPFSFYSRPEADILAIWSDIWTSSAYFEVMSAALMYYQLQRENVSLAAWPQLATWADRVENWAHADSLAGIYSFLLAQDVQQDSQAVLAQIRIWNASENMWLRRISLVSLIHYTGKHAVFMPPDVVLPLVSNCLEDRRYYVQKAVGWVLREMANVHREEVRAYLDQMLPRMTSVARRVALRSRQRHADNPEDPFGAR